MRYRSNKSTVAFIRTHTGISKRDVQDVLLAFRQHLYTELCAGRPVNVYGVGSFTHRFRKGRSVTLTVRGVTKDTVQPDSYHVKFKPSTVLVKAIKANRPIPQLTHKIEEIENHE
jgi:nucleoid DNA-binding protein